MNEDPAPKPPARWFQRKKRDDSATLPQNPKEALEKSWLDKRFDKYAYHISFGVGGLTVAALVASLIASHFWKNLELTQNVYYLSIFIGATLAATLATWRGRQSERQLREFKRQIEDSRSESEIARLERQVARFEKAIDMATDHTSIARRASGFLILNQIFSNWRKDFEHLVEENFAILQTISNAPFWITERKQEIFLNELYKDNRWSYSKKVKADHVKNLFEITSEHKINWAALSLWKEITNWRGERWGGRITTCGICSPISKTHLYFNYVFFRINLEDVMFLVVDDEGRVDISTPGNLENPIKRANFVGSYFVEVRMHNAILDHVNFYLSHFSDINYLEKRDGMFCEMSCKGTIFNRANLINCYFGETDFKDASFSETNISGSDFSQAKNLNPEQFQQDTYWVRPGRPHFPSSFPSNFADLLRDRPPESER